MTSLHFSEIGSIPVTTHNQIRFFLAGLIAFMRAENRMHRSFQILRFRDDELDTDTYKLNIDQGENETYTIEHWDKMSFERLIDWVAYRL